MPWRWPNKLRSRNACLADSAFGMALSGQELPVAAVTDPPGNGHSQTPELRRRALWDQKSTHLQSSLGKKCVRVE
jgi:hypothetical protein